MQMNILSLTLSSTRLYVNLGRKRNACDQASNYSMLVAQLVFLSSQLQQTSPARWRVRIYWWHSRVFISKTHSEPLSSGRPLSQTYFLKGSLGSRFFSSTMLKLKKQKKHKRTLLYWGSDDGKHSGGARYYQSYLCLQRWGGKKTRFLESQPAEAKKGCAQENPNSHHCHSKRKSQEPNMYWSNGKRSEVSTPML